MRKKKSGDSHKASEKNMKKRKKRELHTLLTKEVDPIQETERGAEARPRGRIHPN